MKKQFSLKKTILLTGLLIFLYALNGFAQKKDLKNELVVFILPDSLEIPSSEKGDIDFRKSVINSKSLKTTIEKIRPVSLSKAMPEWNPADSVKTTNEGLKIKVPALDRIFIFTFSDEESANIALAQLKKVNSVVYVHKHNIPTVASHTPKLPVLKKAKKGSNKVFSDPDYYNQWHLKNNGYYDATAGADIKAETAWAIFTGSASLNIAIFDDGVDLSHEDLSGKTTGDDYIPNVSTTHGTHVAGIAAAKANNNLGGRGVDWSAQISSQNILAPSYIGDVATAAKIISASNNGIQIHNHSWQGATFSQTLAQAFAYAFKMNRTTIAAMGNLSGSTASFPAAFNNVIAVGATTYKDQHSSFSNTGSHIDVAAPGGMFVGPSNSHTEIYSTIRGGVYGQNGGTSMAAPQVSGLASLMKGYRSSLFNDDIENIIKLSAHDVEDPGWDNETGHGRIDAGKALELLRDHSLTHLTSYGGTVHASSGWFNAFFFTVSGFADNTYRVKRHEIRKAVTFPSSYCNIQGVWGTGLGSTGYRGDNLLFGEGFCEIVPGTFTSTGATLRTYVYEVTSIFSNASSGTYTTNPANVAFAYSILGQNTDVMTISGPASICTNASYSVNNIPAGATVTWSISDPSAATLSVGTHSVTVIKGSLSSAVPVTLTANITTACGIITKTINITIGTQKPTFSGINPGYTFGVSYSPTVPVTVNAVGTYPPGTTFQWYTTGSITILSGQGTSSVSIAGIPNGQVGTHPFTIIVVAIRPDCGASNGATISGFTSYPPRRMSVFPNPVSGDLTISFEEHNESGVGAELKNNYNAKIATFDYKIFNNQGRLIKSGNENPFDRKLTIDVRNVPNGIYFLHVTEGKETTKKQIIIQH